MTIQKVQTNIKTDESTYSLKYPHSHSNIIVRDTYTIPALLGSNATEVIQNLANNYIPLNGNDWNTINTLNYTDTNKKNTRNVFLTLNNFIGYIGKSNSNFILYYSVDSGRTWANTNNINIGTGYIGAVTLDNNNNFVVTISDGKATGTNYGTHRFIIRQTGSYTTSSVNDVIPTAGNIFVGFCTTRKGLCAVDNKGNIWKNLNNSPTWVTYSTNTGTAANIHKAFWSVDLDRLLGMDSTGKIYLSSTYEATATWDLIPSNFNITYDGDTSYIIGKTTSNENRIALITKSSTFSIKYSTLPVTGVSGEFWNKITINNGTIFIMSNYGKIAICKKIFPASVSDWNILNTTNTTEFTNNTIVSYLNYLYRIVEDTNGQRVQYSYTSPIK